LVEFFAFTEKDQSLEKALFRSAFMHMLSIMLSRKSIIKRWKAKINEEKMRKFIASASKTFIEIINEVIEKLISIKQIEESSTSQTDMQLAVLQYKTYTMAASLGLISILGVFARITAVSYFLIKCKNNLYSP
jgi:hypothetical protein